MKDIKEWGTLTIKNRETAQEFLVLETDPRAQDEWVEHRVPHEHVVVEGYMVGYDPFEMEIEYTYLIPRGELVENE